MKRIYFILILVTLFWAAFVPLGKYAMLFVSPLHFMLTYLPLSYLPILGYMISSGNLSRLREMRLIDLVQLFTWGIVFFFFGNMLYITSLELISASTFGILYNMSPLIVVVLSYLFLKERITKPMMLGFALALLGATIIIFTNSVEGIKTDLFGVLLAFTALLLFSIALVVIKKMLIRYNPYQIIFLLYTGAVVVVVAYSSFWAGFIEPFSLPAEVIWIIIFLGIFAGVVEIAYFYCISMVEISKAVYFRYLSPVFVIFFSYLFLHEVITYKFVIGTVLIFLGLRYVLKRK